jgi:hypothetical protein
MRPRTFYRSSTTYREGTQMFHDFDIFQTAADNTLWIGTAGMLREAMSQIQKSVTASPGTAFQTAAGSRAVSQRENFC